MPRDTARPRVPDGDEKEQLSFTLTSILAKINGHKDDLEANLSYVPDSTKLEIKDVSQKAKLNHLVQHSLRIGTFRGDGDTKYRIVWAHVHGQYASHDQEKRNKISYFDSVGVRLEPQDVKKVTFAQPFQYIKNLDTDHGQEKLRFMILFYFLEAGYLESVEFTVDGFNYFRRAVLDIAKDRKNAGAAPVRTKSSNSSQKIIPRPAPCPRTELLTLSEISHRAISPLTPRDIGNVSAKDTVPSQARKRSTQEREDDEDFERGTKRPNTAYDLELSHSLLQNVRRAFEAEYKPKIAETTALKSQVLELQKQRRESLSIAQIACGKVGKADAERREATAQLIELKTKHNRLLASVAQESEKTKKLFEVEQKARKALEDEKITMQNELTQLRVFRAQFLQLTSPLKGVNKSA